MQIKFPSKMARNEGFAMFHENTVQENRKILQELQGKNQGMKRGAEDLKKLFIKLNRSCQVKTSKEEGHQNSSWYNKNQATNYTYGAIPGFPSGSWWGIRMDCSRDRVHDPFDEDFQNGPFGVTSICTSSTNTNEDIDLGDTLTITGERYSERETRKDPLVTNYENQVPIRLIRSYNLLNQYAPKTGYRYDGLYAVVGFWVGVNSDTEKYNKFALVRLTSQEPAPWCIKRPAVDAKQSFSTIYSETKVLKTCTEYPALGAYEFRKYSHSETRKKSKQEGTKEAAKFSDTESATSAEKSKGTPESVIVTRHVFKKSNTENSSTTSTSSTLDNKSLMNIDQGSKAHSTNISIRTGLYDSSHGIQHDAKKNTLTSYCRPTKPVTILKTNMHTDNLGMLNRDRSKTDVKIDIPTISNKMQQADAWLNCRNNAVNTLTPRSSNDIKEKITQANASADSPKLINCNPLNAPRLDSGKCKIEPENDSTNASLDAEKRTHEETQTDVERRLNGDANHPASSTSTSHGENGLQENEGLTQEDHENSLTAHGLKFLDSLDTLTPDKILYLIDKQKCHPLSKLLMGNMIGFTSEQSVTLRTSDVANLHTDLNAKEGTEKKSYKAASDDLIGSRCYKFRRRKKLARKIVNKPDGKVQTNSVGGSGQSSTFFDTYNEDAAEKGEDNSEEEAVRPSRREHLRGTRSKKSAMVLPVGRRTNVPKTIESENSARGRLRNVKVLRSSVKKHLRKKKRREIANLLIDAKIGPKVRGPRNRRLRSINTVYAKRSYEPFSTMIRTLNKRKINTETPERRSVFESGSKLGKVRGRPRLRDKQTQEVNKTDALSLKETNQKYERLPSKITESANTIPRRGRKRKLISTISVDLNRNGVKDRYQKSRDKEATKPCTTDAITQCSLISEEFVETPVLYRSPRERASIGDYVRLDRRNGQQTIIKMERAESGRLKSEMHEGPVVSDDENYEVYVVRRERAGYIEDVDRSVDIEARKSSRLEFRDRSPPPRTVVNLHESPMRQASAFVPVNTLDSDLRIARLRSIGFKPITSEFGGAEREDDHSGSSGSKVIKQDVAEKYNKYTNEENSVVIYMDEELQYQEIEDEVEVAVEVDEEEEEEEDEDEDEEVLSGKRRKTSTSTACVDSPHPEHELKREEGDRGSARSLRKVSLPEQDLEAPWHGWKKVVTSEYSYWIGW